MSHLNMLASLGAIRQERRFNIISNNLVNAQTAGFKRDVPIFSKIASKALERVASQEMDGQTTFFQTGEIQKTGNPLDLSIGGEGFFKIKTPNGTRYTRTGNFVLSKDKKLITSSGFPVLGRKGEIVLNGGQIAIETDGRIRVDGNEVDQIALVTFADTKELRKDGFTLFKMEGSQAEKKVDQTQALQGSLESSNVNVMAEMIQLMDALRTYESCLKVIQSKDETDSRAVNDLGRVS